MTTPYGKGWLSFEDQIRMLELRGIEIDNPQGARDFFRHVNYYRFNSYCQPFETARHSYAPGTTFSLIRALYEFDRALRGLLAEAIEIIEIDLRTTVGYFFGQQHGCFGHIEAGNFHRTFPHADWHGKLQGDAVRSRELFIENYRAKYQEYPDLPIWIAVEIMPFGELSRMFRGMTARDQKPVVERYGIPPLVFSSWLHHLVYVHNLCAHNSRLWDRAWSVKPKLPRALDWMPPMLPDGARLFATLLIISRLLQRCPAQGAFASRWRTAVEHHIAALPPVPDGLARMGLPKNWIKHSKWKLQPV